VKKLSNQKPKGLHSLEIKDCGCRIKRYTGGRVMLMGCRNHDSFTKYVCPVCGKKYSKKPQLIECRWSHAI